MDDQTKKYRNYAVRVYVGQTPSVIEIGDYSSELNPDPAKTINVSSPQNIDHQLRGVSFFIRAMSPEEAENGILKKEENNLKSFPAYSRPYILPRVRTGLVLTKSP